MFSHQDAKQGVPPPTAQAHLTPWPCQRGAQCMAGLQLCCANLTQLIRALLHEKIPKYEVQSNCVAIVNNRVFISE